MSKPESGSSNIETFGFNTVDGFRLTTNNRMELLAVIVGLEALKKEGNDVTVYSDSKYVVDSVEKKWVFNWEKKAYKGKKNSDLWKR